jgi:hypothetical protein
LSGCKRQAGMPVLLIAIGQIILLQSLSYHGVTGQQTDCPRYRPAINTLIFPAYLTHVIKSGNCRNIVYVKEKSVNSLEAN